MKRLVTGLMVTLCASASAFAQSVAPMKKEITSFAESFMFQVHIKNTYDQGQISHIELFDMDWNPVEGGYTTHKSAFLGAGQELVVTAMVPFKGEKFKQVYLCHSITPRVNGKGSAYRGEVCGKYIARRLS